MYAFLLQPRPNKIDREFTRVIDKHAGVLHPVPAQTRHRERESLKCERGSSAGREMDRKLMPGVAQVRFLNAAVVGMGAATIAAAVKLPKHDDPVSTSCYYNEIF